MSAMKEIFLVVLVFLLIALIGGLIKWLFCSKKKLKLYIKEDFDPNYSYLFVVFVLIAVLLLGKLIIYFTTKF